METLFKTRITELYGIRLPIIASGLMWLANADYVGAAVNAGLMGFMTAASFPDPDELRREIRRYKEKLVATDETQTMLVLQSLRKTQRALATEKARLVKQLEAEHGGDIDVLLPHIAGKVGRKAYETGDFEEAVLSCGQSVVFADRIEPLAAIVARLEDEARAALERLEGLRVVSPAAATRPNPLRKASELT